MFYSLTPVRISSLYDLDYIGLKIAVVSYGPGKILNSDRQIKLDLELKNLFDAAVLYEY